ncbi:MAG: hypothetical protein CMC82_03110 [Flavobacteriaceae bacterium]|nr:hypothetical protein [Flavobacteriaceae bacterium]|tara:strand:+ start:4277 stop:4717 length:441 start_codon:yes stop_codon:yes gene_type:complete
MFSIFLTKNNLNNGVFLSLMKFNMHRKTCCFIFCVLINCSYVMGQQAQTQIRAPQKLDSLLQKKIALDRLNAAKKQFTIQIFYGNFEETTAELARFETLFPNMIAQLIHETPNYKIRVGSFTNEREALAELEKVKGRFSSAFVLKP